ncbi:MAG: GGDEF domain-containing protein [Pseudomonadota bacterium]
MQKIIYYIGNLDKRVLLFCSVILVFLLGYLDYLSGFEFSFSLFYLLPVSILAWFVNRNSALAVSLLSALAWFISNKLAGETTSHPFIALWNTIVRLGFFTIVSLLLTDLKQVINKERSLSRTDYLTGITNSRHFYELTSFELLRAKRYNHPITIAYIDLDNFKQINDQFGHSVGDVLLRVVAETLRTHLRQTDIVARMGGDEFVALLIETDEDSAKVAITKAQIALLETMEQRQWGVTFSIGAITFHVPPPGVDEALRQVDELMYTVKLSGKNNVRFEKAG